MWWKGLAIVNCVNHAVRRKPSEPSIDFNPRWAHRGELVTDVTLNREVENVVRKVTHGDNVVSRPFVLVVIECREDDTSELIVAVRNTKLTAWP